MSPTDILSGLQLFGFSKFRDGQEDIVQSVLGSEDVVAVLPTGGGKSLCYQLPAMLLPGTTLIVSPLIALMKDQVDSMARKNIPATFINSTLSSTEMEERVQKVRRGEYKIVYVAPERFKGGGFVRQFPPGLISLFAVDECHCHPSGTLIRMSDGSDRPIEQVHPGDIVLSSNGCCVTRRKVVESQIKHVGTRQLLKVVTPCGNVLLTDDHPVFVRGRGYVKAGSVRAGDVLLRVVQMPVVSRHDQARRKVLQFSVLRGCATRRNQTSARQGLSNLWEGVRLSPHRTRRAEVLLPKMLARARTPFLASCLSCLSERVQVPGKSNLFSSMRTCSDVRGCVQVHAVKQPHEVGGSQEESIGFIGGTFDATSSGRKRSATAEATGIVALALSSGQGRVRCFDIGQGSKGEADSLQTGSCLSRTEVGRRVRRTLTQGTSSSGSRRAARFATQDVRVDRVEVVEPNDNERDPQSGYDSRVVYALTVEQDHSYFANGILTHNCISQWGHDFRPDYLNLREAIRSVGSPRVLALTATATDEVRRDVVSSLGLGSNGRKPPRIFVRGFTRPNLTLSVEQAYEKLDVIRDIIDEFKTGIVYCSTRKNVDAVKDDLRDAGVPLVVAYHAGMTDKERLTNQNLFMARAVNVVVATNAFGMGIDRPDLRFVIHYNIPGTLEAYYQEAGRAGRDGEKSICKLLYDPMDCDIQEFFIEGSNPSAQLISDVYATVKSLCLASGSIKKPIPEIAKAVGGRSNETAVGTALKLLERVGGIKRSRFGRAGAYTTTVPNPDRSVNQLGIDFDKLHDKRVRDFAKFRKMVQYARSSGCRHKDILDYFGEESKAVRCSACDNCLGEMR